jgi:hypothetical protein
MSYSSTFNGTLDFFVILSFEAFPLSALCSSCLMVTDLFLSSPFFGMGTRGDRVAERRISIVLIALPVLCCYAVFFSRGYLFGDLSYLILHTLLLSRRCDPRVQSRYSLLYCMDSFMPLNSSDTARLSISDQYSINGGVEFHRSC